MFGETIRYHCPLDDCAWFIDEEAGAIDSDILKATFGEGGMKASKRALIDDVEARLQQHTVGHNPFDFLKTIARLREENTRLKAKL